MQIDRGMFQYQEARTLESIAGFPSPLPARMILWGLVPATASLADFRLSRSDEGAKVGRASVLAAERARTQRRRARSDVPDISTWWQRETFLPNQEGLVERKTSE